MLVKILKVEPTSGEKPRVYFSSEVGEAWANWLEGLPEPGQNYNVELSVEDTLTWGVDILPTPNASHQIQPDGEGVAIYATLEECEEDGFTVLRIGQGILMLQAYGNPPPIGTIVRAQLQVLTLSDTTI